MHYVVVTETKLFFTGFEFHTSVPMNPNLNFISGITFYQILHTNFESSLPWHTWLYFETQSCTENEQPAIIDLRNIKRETANK